MNIKYSATLTLLAIMCCTASPVRADEPEPGRIDSHISDDHVDLEAWARSDDPSATPELASSKTQVRMVKAYVPACEGNWPDSPDSLGTLCQTATTMCVATPDPQDLGYWIFTAQASANPRDHNSWQPTGEYACRSAADPNDNPAAIEPVITVEDFRRLPLPAAVIEVQPPTRRTLINIPTNLYAGASTVVLPTTVLGQAVRVRATPLRFHWTYGDGATLTTADPGAAYPALRTAHTYRAPGTRELGLSTTYSGEYSVADGAWQPIDGVATVPSPGTALTVLAADNRLVATPLP